mmetsp:Transcript_2346/g.6972  ORF Transcript_2346/g.6972 Transcript_2346/m.6972 type:complete len:248 (+) Transcript_2346:1659-2402(+)
MARPAASTAAGSARRATLSRRPAATHRASVASIFADGGVSAESDGAFFEAPASASEASSFQSADRVAALARTLKSFATRSRTMALRPHLVHKSICFCFRAFASPTDPAFENAPSAMRRACASPSGCLKKGCPWKGDISDMLATRATAVQASTSSLAHASSIAAKRAPVGSCAMRAPRFESRAASPVPSKAPRRASALAALRTFAGSGCVGNGKAATLFTPRALACKTTSSKGTASISAASWSAKVSA